MVVDKRKVGIIVFLVVLLNFFGSYAREVCYIQLASFKHKKTAVRYFNFVNRIPYRVILVKKGKWYAVRLGPFDRKECSVVSKQIMKDFPYSVFVFTDKDQTKDTLKENMSMDAAKSPSKKKLVKNRKVKSEKKSKPVSLLEKREKSSEKKKNKSKVAEEKHAGKDVSKNRQSYVDKRSEETVKSKPDVSKESEGIIPDRVQLQQVYIEKAKVCMGKKDCQNAIKYLQMAISLGDRSSKTYTYLGYAYYHTGNYAKAIDTFNKAIKVDSGYAEAYEGMGLAYLKLDAFSVAKTALKKAYELKPDEISYGINYAVSCIQTGDLDESLETFDEIESSYPLIPEVHYNKAIVFMKKGDNKSAVKELKTFVELAKSSYYEAYIKDVKAVIRALESGDNKAEK